MNRTQPNFNKRRLLRLILTAVLILSSFSLLSIPVRAAEPTYEFSDEYEESVYFEEFSDYELTGDMRRDVVSIAYTQLGYHEGNHVSELHGRNVYGSRNFTEYNRIWGALDNGEGNGVSVGYAWCAAFVTWCLRQSQVPAEVAASVGLDKHRERAVRNIAFTGIGAVAQVVLLVVPSLATAGNGALTKVLLLYLLLIYLLNSFCLYRCFSAICPQGEEFGKPSKPSRFKFMNELNRKLDEKNEQARLEYEKSQQRQNQKYSAKNNDRYHKKKK